MNLNKEGLVLVDFYATWCPPCKLLSPLIDQLAEERKDSLHVIKVNVDEEVELADSFKIYAVPTLVLINEGKEIARSEGYIPYEELLEFVNINK